MGDRQSVGCAGATIDLGAKSNTPAPTSRARRRRRARGRAAQRERGQGYSWTLFQSISKPAARSSRPREMPDGIFMVTDALTALNRKRVFEFAAAHLVPAIYEYEFLARDGGLTAYGPDGKEWGERVADLVDRILKGAKPADLPFEQPTRFRFVINLERCAALGLTLPPARLAAADEVIGSSRGGKR